MRRSGMRKRRLARPARDDEGAADADAGRDAEPFQRMSSLSRLPCGRRLVEAALDQRAERGDGA